jgi:spermidine synthase
MARALFTLLAIGLCVPAAFSQVSPVSIETPYNHITIEHFGSVVEMRSLWRTTVYRESAIDLTDLPHLVVPYTKLIAASAVFDPSPKNVLMIGLGGGGFNQFFEKAFPDASLDTVELDPAVFNAAKQYMAFRTTERDKVTISDGRTFLRRSKKLYDWIILDAFRGGFVPPHLKTVEFYRLAQSHLATDGIFVANVHNNTALFAADLQTMHAVFPQVGFFDVSLTANAVVVGANFAAPSFQEIVKKAEPSHFNETFRRNVDLANIGNVFHVVGRRAHEDTAPILTDDFAPTEFLEAVKNNNARH